MFSHKTRERAGVVFTKETKPARHYQPTKAEEHFKDINLLYFSCPVTLPENLPGAEGWDIQASKHCFYFGLQRWLWWLHLTIKMHMLVICIRAIQVATLLHWDGMNHILELPVLFRRIFWSKYEEKIPCFRKRFWKLRLTRLLDFHCIKMYSGFIDMYIPLCLQLRDMRHTQYCTSLKFQAQT